MNMRIQPKLTPAETALVSAYGERHSALPGDAAVTMFRDEAIELVKAGLPTRRVESWHYTDLRRMLTSVPAEDQAAPARAVEPLVAGSAVAAVLNGVGPASAGMLGSANTRPLREKLRDGSFARALRLQGSDDAIGAINAAFVSDGVFLDIADGTVAGAPIEVQNIHAGGQVHTRLPVRVGKGVRATLVERQTGTGLAMVSSVSHLMLGEDSELIWIILQEQPQGATYLGQFNAELGRNSKLTLFVMNTGGKLVRQEIRVNAAGEGSSFTLRGVNLLAGDTHTDVTMVLDHAVPNTSSTEVVRNVVTGRARGVFQGRINVAQYAQKTDAKMACNTLLLSDEGEFSTKPELEIFADDVQCGHGATVTEIDRNHLFYLMARGIDERTARGLLVRAFVAEVIEDLDDEALVAALEARLQGWFLVNG